MAPAIPCSEPDGKRKNVGRVIVPQEIAFQLLKLAIVGDEALERPAGCNFVNESLAQRPEPQRAASAIPHVERTPDYCRRRAWVRSAAFPAVPA
jgi:hypothetical protein